MAWENVKHRMEGVEASGDLSTKQFFFVVLDSNDQAAVNTSAGGIVDGVLQNKPDAQGKAAEVAPLDGASVSKVVAGAAVSVGDRVQSDANGKAITTASAKYSAGKARTAAGAEDDLISVQLISYGREA